MMTFDNVLAKLEFEKIRQRVIRYASSEPGQEVLRDLQISTSLDEIRSELARVSEMKRLLEEEDFSLEGIFQIRASAQRASVEGTVLQPRELVQIGSTLKAARVLRLFASKHRESFPILWAIVDPLYVDKVLEFNIEQAVDETGTVRANASRELLSIRRAIADRYDQLKKRLEGILRTVSDLGFSQDEIITTREGRMVIPVKAEHKNRVHGFIHSASSSGATVFIEPSETLELNNDIRSLQFQEQREIEHILRDLTVQVGAVKEQCVANLRILAQVDAVHAKAKYSIEILGIEPEVSLTAPVKLAGARHPVLMLTHGHQGTVPLDLEIGGAYRTLVISGPNAGGKSVAMKCVGLLALMVQAGLHIPASDHSTMRIFSKIFVDIGDEQSIENDLSTFSSHLANLKQIAAEAEAGSLVLIDEIGSGTDPSEGGALAAALLEWLTQRGACTIATTHQGSLKVFAYETPGVENGAMEFDQATLTPTYTFKSGIPGSSYALEMADRLGFNPALMERTRALLGHQQAKLESLIQELEAAAQRYRKQLETTAAEKTRLDEMVHQYEAKVASLSSELRELKRKALEEAGQIVEKANATIERSVREIRETAAARDTVREVRQNVARLKEEIAAGQKDVAPEPAPKRKGPLGVGSIVSLTGREDSGEIVGLSPDSKTATVVFGSVKMRVRMTDLEPSERRRAARPVPQALPEKPESPETEVDVRGMTGEEAIPIVDKFLDSAILVGLHRVDIIHGKGTGALRKKITEFLSHHPRVKAYRLGEWNEGGTGATVVELSEG